ncbi:hypothetical protein MRX96_008218 [Rhipicephalus microplus]
MERGRLQGGGGDRAVKRRPGQRAPRTRRAKTTRGSGVGRVAIAARAPTFMLFGRPPAAASSAAEATENGPREEFRRRRRQLPRL